MKKPVVECNDLRDFLTSNYELDDLRIFADDCEEIVNLHKEPLFLYIELYTAFENEINSEWLACGFEEQRDSFWGLNTQKLLVSLQSRCEAIVYEHDNPDCGE